MSSKKMPEMEDSTLILELSNPLCLALDSTMINLDHEMKMKTKTKRRRKVRQDLNVVKSRNEEKLDFDFRSFGG